MTLRARKLLVYAAAVALLLAVLVLYTRPQIMVVLSEQVWACFQ